MEHVRLALVQMRCEKGAITENLRLIDAHLGAAAARGVAIACFPEMSITGYIDPHRWPDAVLTLDSTPVREFVAMTGHHHITALAGIVEANPDGKPFITQVVASNGGLLGVYRKRTIPEDEAPWFAPSGAVAVFPHPAGAFGVAICADIDNPTVFADAAAQGARLIFEAAAPGLYGDQAGRDWRAGWQWWRGECYDKLGRYAREHGFAIAVATQAGRTVDEDFPGGGYLFGPDGGCIAQSEDWSEGVLYVSAPAGAAVADAPSA